MSFTDLLAFKKSFLKEEKHFLSKCSNYDTETSKTLAWLKFALKCNYLDKDTFVNFNTKNSENRKIN